MDKSSWEKVETWRVQSMIFVWDWEGQRSCNAKNTGVQSG